MMATLQFKIPYESISTKTSLSWTDIQYGLDHSLISAKVAIQHADGILKNVADPQPEEIEISGLSDADPVLDLVSVLSSREDNHDANLVRDKWLFLVLAWVYENKEGLADPLATVEAVYSDFDYPRSIASFVHYMPMQGPDLGSSEKNIARLFGYWKDYLAVAGKQFAPSPSLRR